MIYYIGLTFLICFKYFLNSNLKNKRQGQKLFFLFSCTFIILFQGFRSFNVGTDLVSYIPSYAKMNNGDFSNLIFLNYEKGYVFYNKLLGTLGFDERQFLIITSGIIQILIFYTMFEYSEKPLLSVLVYFAFGNFIMTFSGLRQAIAMAICFFSYKFIKKKKIIFYIILILVASLFHTSALFCIFVYPLYFLKMDNDKFIFYLILIFTFFIFRNHIILIANQIYYGNARSVEITNAFTMFLIYTLFYVVTFLLPNFNDSDFIGLRNILFVLCLIFSLASVSNIFTRVGYPLTLYLTIFVPKVVKKINIKPSNIIRDIFCYIICILCFFYFVGGLDTLPFSFL